MPATFYACDARDVLRCRLVGDVAFAALALALGASFAAFAFAAALAFATSFAADAFRARVPCTDVAFVEVFRRKKEQKSTDKQCTSEERG